LTQTYSYADYLSWQLKERVKLINSKIMPLLTPNIAHQRISRKPLLAIAQFLTGKQSEIFLAPFDVRLYDRKKSILASQDIHTVVQPDLCVICNPDILDKQGCNGAPDWIIEILSAGNSKREKKIKYALYQESGVKEYWLVYPEQRAIHKFVLDESGRYQLIQMFTNDDIASPQLFPELVINLTEVF
jgi:Uma2 family endonuclease